MAAKMTLVTSIILLLLHDAVSQQLPQTSECVSAYVKLGENTL